MSGASTQPQSAPQILLPRSPVLVAGLSRAVWLSVDGEVETLTPAQAAAKAKADMPVACHAPAMAARMGCAPFPAYDVLELFAFVHPATFCVPTPAGVAAALGLARPNTLEDQAMTLLEAARALLAALADAQAPQASDPVRVALAMGRGGWPWTPGVMAALDVSDEAVRNNRLRGSYDVWSRMNEWEETAPEPPPGHEPVSEDAARDRLHDLLHANDVPGKTAPHKTPEDRPEQGDYAATLAHAFMPRLSEDAPNTVLAEAGTGIGKTLGYLAPATVWAEKNKGSVWISTYTRNLQRQIDDELSRLFPDAEEKAEKVVVRKGRENYLCLLNLEEASRSQTLQTDTRNATAVGLMARWAAATRDGDLTGGDFPGWLPGLMGRNRTVGMADRRGECIYSACDHYHRCFVERSLRNARRAEVVIANHALVMINAALSGDDDVLPQRYVFDEGHHLFEAADSAFAGHLTGMEMTDLRRWLIGTDARRSRARGLKRRVEDLLSADPGAAEALDKVLHYARLLPADSWRQRLHDHAPHGAAEEFLGRVRRQVYTRVGKEDAFYSIETDVHPLDDGLLEAAKKLAEQLAHMQKPMLYIAQDLRQRLEDEADDLDSDTRRRIEAAASGVERRARLHLSAWLDMLKALSSETPEEFVDWFMVERVEGRDLDVGMYRHWVDPMKPFSQVIRHQTQGLAITSATLRDATGDEQADWRAAEERTGMQHLHGGFGAPGVIRSALASPYDYAGQTRVLVVDDVKRTDVAQVAAAYRALFMAANGGALGIFTAIQRLRAVQERIAEKLEGIGLPLYAQHVDGLEVSTLIDVFRDQRDACLLGTDAVRDGIDVPGDSLRLIVFDRVPWPRPGILHRARREGFGKKRYDDMMTRLKLKQAYGRLVRRADDRGVFVLLDALPSRLKGAFPPGVQVERMGLAEAVAITRDFLQNS